MSAAPTASQLAPSCSDHQLVAAVRDGSDRAFEELYSRYHARIGTYIRGMVGDRARSEDVAQEVFFSALRRMRDTERPIMFKPWIYAIAKHACVDEFRRTRRAREVPLELDPERQLHCAPPASTPEVAIESKQQLQDLRGAFAGLSESQHRIIVLRELEGLSYREIGSRLGISKPTVESALHRARQRLGEEYDELVSGRRCAQIETLLAADGSSSLRRLGLRARRQLARHLAHCQRCRRQARVAGLDDKFFHVPGARGKLAALLPWPAFLLRPWRRGQAQSLAQYLAPAAPGIGVGRAAAAAAVLVVGGAGGGLVSTLAAPSGARSVHGAAARAEGGTAAARKHRRPAWSANRVDRSHTAARTHGPAWARALRAAPSGGAARKTGPAANSSQAAGTAGHGNPLNPLLRILPGAGGGARPGDPKLRPPAAGPLLGGSSTVPATRLPLTIPTLDKHSATKLALTVTHPQRPCTADRHVERPRRCGILAASGRGAAW